VHCKIFEARCHEAEIEAEARKSETEAEAEAECRPAKVQK